MGWTSQHTTIAAVVEETTRRRTWTNADGAVVERATLARCLRGFTLYYVTEDVWTARDGSETRERWIGVTLVRRTRDGVVTWKNMQESMHPFSYDCPLAYLDMVPDIASVAWRMETRSRAAKAAAARALLNGAAPGDVFVLHDGIRPRRVTFERKRGRMALCRAAGRLFRIPPSYIESVERSAATA